MNAYLAGVWAHLEAIYGDLLDLADGMDEASVNWSPPVPEPNSIAVLVRHIIGSNSMWCSVALDEPFERDRDAEFRVHETPPTLVTALMESVAAVRGQFDRLDAIDPTTERRVRRPTGSDDATYSVGWCLAHVVRHSGEHWGQIQLTRDFYRART